MPKKRKLTELERDNLERVKKCRQQCEREANRPSPHWPKHFAALEAAYLEQHPHLAEQKHCGLAEDSDRPVRRVVCPNGVVLYSTWYKVPTTDADHKRAWKESEWLMAEGRRLEAAEHAAQNGEQEKAA